MGKETDPQKRAGTKKRKKKKKGFKVSVSEVEDDSAAAAAAAPPQAEPAAPLQAEQKKKKKKKKQKQKQKQEKQNQKQPEQAEQAELDAPPPPLAAPRESSTKPRYPNIRGAAEFQNRSRRPGAEPASPPKAKRQKVEAAAPPAAVAAAAGGDADSAGGADGWVYEDLSACDRSAALAMLTEEFEGRHGRPPSAEQLAVFLAIADALNLLAPSPIVTPVKVSGVRCAHYTPVGNMAARCSTRCSATWRRRLARRLERRRTTTRPGRRTIPMTTLTSCSPPPSRGRPHAPPPPRRCRRCRRCRRSRPPQPWRSRSEPRRFGPSSAGRMTGSTSRRERRRSADAAAAGHTAASNMLAVCRQPLSLSVLKHQSEGAGGVQHI